MRYWWIDAVKCIASDYNSSYANVTVLDPPSIFADKTIVAQQFEDDFTSEILQGL